MGKRSACGAVEGAGTGVCCAAANETQMISDARSEAILWRKFMVNPRSSSNRCKKSCISRREQSHAFSLRKAVIGEHWPGAFCGGREPPKRPHDNQCKS